MKTVVLDEFTVNTNDSHVFGHGISSGYALQYYGGCTGLLIRWTPTFHKRLSCESVNVDTETRNGFCIKHNPYCKQIN